MATNAPEEQSAFGPGANPGSEPDRPVAISVKQPWAALLVAGVKTVEVRTWRTARRGRVVIHAAKVADARPEGWALVATPELRELAALRGGMIGEGELVDCVRYATREAFAAAAPAHRNAPEWFRPAGLYGFVFQNLRPIAYHACPGKTMFFTADGFTLA